MEGIISNRTRYCQIVHSLIKSIIAKAILLNLIYFIFMLIFFKPTFSVDDSAMSTVIYGAYSETYDYHSTNVNFWYGKIIVFLLKILPNIPWYTVLFYIWIFIALTIMTFIFLKWQNNFLGFIISNILLCFFSYEGYIAIQFTKVAAIVGGIGFFALIIFHQSWKIRVAGVFLVLIACLIRHNVVPMSIAVCGFALVTKLILDRIIGKKFKIKELKTQLFWFIIGVVIYLGVPFLPQYVTDKEAFEWTEYSTWSYGRVGIQDYGVPEYDENIEVYKELGVTENDLYIWNSWNNDHEALDARTGAIIRTLQPKAQSIILKIFNKENIFNFFKQFPNVFLNIDVYFAFLLLVIIVGFLCDIKAKIWLGALFFSEFFLLLLNYYLYINGRYLQHRVDIGIIFSICIMFIFLIMDGIKVSEINRKNQIRMASIVICLVLVVPFKNYSDDIAVVNDETMKTNRFFFENTNNDKEHYYVFGNTRENSAQKSVCFSAFEVVPIGFFENVYMSSPTPIILNNFRKYRIENPYKDIVNNNGMYFVMASWDNNQEAWETYIRDRIGKKVDLVMVKDFLDKRIYRVTTGDLDDILQVKDQKIVYDSIEAEISYHIENRKLTLNGYAYVKGFNDFAQNVYIEIQDSQTEKSKLYYTLQSSNTKFDEGEEGFFSNISASITLPRFYDRRDKVYLLIENNGQYFKKKIN